MYTRVVHAELWVLSLSLSMEAGRSTFDIMVGLPLHAWGALRFVF